jgi:hypothetical protein
MVDQSAHGSMIGWQICHRDTGEQPPEHPSYAVYSFNYVMTWLANVPDRPCWRLCPIYEEDIEKPHIRTAFTNWTALEEAKKYASQLEAKSGG